MKASFVILLFVLLRAKGDTLDTVSDDDLLELIREREKLIVFFTKSNCEICEKYETILEELDEDFNKHLNAVTVKAENSHLVRLYNPRKEPAIVFFRHGVPLLFEGKPKDIDIYEYLEKNQTPAVKELTDKIFEHMTQAGTGATTGDWFVMFYSASCVDCQYYHALWEGVGASLRGRVNVARVDAKLGGLNTAKRFKVNNLPTFIFFRLGKMYRFEFQEKSIVSAVAFAQDWYRNVKAEHVPLVPSPFDELVDWCVEKIRTSVAFGLDILAEHPWIWQIGFAGFGLVAITAIIALIKAGKSRPAKETKKDKKSK